MPSLRFDSDVTSHDPTAALVQRVAVTKYGSRYWAVWFDGELAVVAVYRKGARRVAELLADGMGNVDRAQSNGPDENARVYEREEPGLPTG